MEKIFPLIILSLFFLFLISQAKAQVELLPGQTQFVIDSIVLEPEFKSLLLKGDYNYLNIFWKASYLSGEKRDIGIKCYLNCFNPGDNIEENCAGFQNCSSVVKASSQGTCTIVSPNYFFDKKNMVVCKLYDPKFSSIEYKPYLNKSFWALNFTLLPLENINTNVGNEISIEVRVKNLGLLTDNYTINISYPTNLVSAPKMEFIEGVKSEEIGRKKIRVIPLIATSAKIDLFVYSNSSSWTFNCPTCPSNFVCEPASGKCSKKVTVILESGYSSLNEIGLAEIILLIFVALVLIYRKGP